MSPSGLSAAPSVMSSRVSSRGGTGTSLFDDSTEVGAQSDRESIKSYETMSSLNSNSSSSSYYSETDREAEPLSDLQRSQSPQFMFIPNEQAPVLDFEAGELQAPIPPQLFDLLSLQKADGSFNLNGSLRLVVGDVAVDEGTAICSS